MSDQIENQNTDDQEESQDNAAELAAAELEGLKARATAMGLPFHPAISAPKLREKISAHLAAENNPSQPAGMPAAAPVVAAAPVPTGVIAGVGAQLDPAVPAPLASGRVAAIENEDTGTTKYALAETPNEKRRRIKRNAEELIRVRVTCMNPAKKDWSGEIFTVGNSAVGTIKKFVPFNAEEGWHVPRMILEMMEQRVCQIFVNKKTSHGVTVKEGKQIREFNIERLHPLDEEALEELARRQAMAAGENA